MEGYILNSHKRKILFISERRADYSRLKPIMRMVKESPILEMQLVVTGIHLLDEFGSTKDIIKSDGFKIDAIIEMFQKNHRDDGESMAAAMGRVLSQIPYILGKMKPTIVFTGFDLGANLAAAIAAMHMNIYVSHIQGGEVSGTIDEIIRHAITKFSHIHFAATEKSRRRIIKLGENPEFVFNVGSPSLDTIRSIKYESKQSILKKLGFSPDKKLLILLQHPVTTEEHAVESQMDALLRAADSLRKRVDISVLAIYSNNDTGGKRIIQALLRSNIKVVPHIPFEDFLRLMKVSDVLLGNTSAGIHEAPSFGLPFVNVGSRQQFRERGRNVIDVSTDRNSILKGLERALFDEKFKEKARRAKNPYDGGGNTASKIVHILETISLPPIQKVISY